MGFGELVMMILLLGTDVEPQGASLFNQDSIVELINLASPEERRLPARPGDDSTLYNTSLSASGALGLRAGLGEGKDQMEQGETGRDEMCPTHHAAFCFGFAPPTPMSLCLLRA